MALPAPTDQIVLAGPRHGISIEGAQDVAPFLFELIPQWPVLPAPVTAAQAVDGQDSDDAPAPSDIVVQDQGGHWRISSAHMALSDFDLDDGYMLANTLVGALIAGAVYRWLGSSSSEG